MSYWAFPVWACNRKGHFQAILLTQRSTIMPIYEFKCQSCDNVFESLRFPSDGDGDIACPSCGGKNNEKLLSAFACISSSSTEGLPGCAASPNCAAGEGGAAYPSCASSGGFS